MIFSFRRRPQSILRRCTPALSAKEKCPDKLFHIINPRFLQILRNYYMMAVS